MSEVSDEIEKVQVGNEFRSCATCGYDRGFHVSFMPQSGEGRLRLILICPSCGARYEISDVVV